jgi:hypothetical protein
MSVDYSKLSDAELEALAAGDYKKLSDATLMALAGEPSGDYKAESARKGFAGSVASALAAAGSALTAESAMQRAAARSMGANVPPAELVSPGRTFGELRSAVYDPLMAALGTTGAKPQTGTERIIGAGATCSLPSLRLGEWVCSVKQLLDLLKRQRLVLVRKQERKQVGLLVGKLVLLLLEKLSAVLLAAARLSQWLDLYPGLLLLHRPLNQNLILLPVGLRRMSLLGILIPA